MRTGASAGAGKNAATIPGVGLARAAGVAGLELEEAEEDERHLRKVTVVQLGGGGLFEIRVANRVLFYAQQKRVLAADGETSMTRRWSFADFFFVWQTSDRLVFY